MFSVFLKSGLLVLQCIHWFVLCCKLEFHYIHESISRLYCTLSNWKKCSCSSVVFCGISDLAELASAFLLSKNPTNCWIFAILLTDWVCFFSVMMVSVPWINNWEYQVKVKLPNASSTPGINCRLFFNHVASSWGKRSSPHLTTKTAFL